MDSFDGLVQEPVTLHKYLYANADSVNYTDHTGNFSLGSFGAASNISGILARSVQVLEKGLNILDFVTAPLGAMTGKLTNKALGVLLLLGRTGKKEKEK